MILNHQSFIETFTNPENSVIIETIYYFLVIPAIFLWFYNMQFLFRKDRYSKSIIPLLIFSFIYSPIYYYKVNIKKRPLINEIKSEPVIVHTIQLEAYENESDFEDDLNGIKDNYNDEIKLKEYSNIAHKKSIKIKELVDDLFE